VTVSVKRTNLYPIPESCLTNTLIPRSRAVVVSSLHCAGLVTPECTRRVIDPLYHSRHNDRDRQYECDRGISSLNTHLSHSRQLFNIHNFTHNAYRAGNGSLEMHDHDPSDPLEHFTTDPLSALRRKIAYFDQTLPHIAIRLTKSKSG